MFPAITNEHIAKIFNEAVATLPKRLLGVMRPGVLDEYSITLLHHALGTHQFVFSAGRIKRDAGLITFFRECREVEGKEERLLEREQACLARSSRLSPTKPCFFQASMYKAAGKKLFARDGLLVEVGWDVDSRGKLKVAKGRLRYPVTYAAAGDGTLSSAFSSASAVTSISAR